MSPSNIARLLPHSWLWRMGALLCAMVLLSALSLPQAAAASYAQANGTGSSYAGLAFQQWVQQGQTMGLPVNYTPTSSPNGLQQYEDGTVPFAGTEAEFSSLIGVPDASVKGGFEYTPDVAGATAVMYNVADSSGRTVTYLHLDPLTIARIFMGYITNWDDPEITRDNLNKALPSHPITIIYRAGQSGTTALFYDFVKNSDPSQFYSWANAHHLPTTTRILQLDNGSDFAPLTEAVSGSDQQAEAVVSQQWSISYDEFSYPKTYGAQVAWVENASGHWTQPYALNITAALQSATLNPDLSQNLTGVYKSTNPLTYPISAYSYIVTKCVTNSQFPTCKGSYSNPGVSATLAKWMSYIGCAGQASMAEIGYAPLPPSLSQDMANSVARLLGKPATQLTAGNCANPRFQGYLGVGAAGPPDPYLGRSPSTGSIGGGGSGSGSGSGGGSTGLSTGSGSGGGTTGLATGGSAPTTTNPTLGVRAPTGSGSGPGSGKVGHSSGSTGSTPGSSTNPQTESVRNPNPSGYRQNTPGGVPLIPLLVFLGILIVPAIAFESFRRFGNKS